MRLSNRLANLRFELRGLHPARFPPAARRVLIYHGVTTTGDRRFNSRFVSAKRLAADLRALTATPGLRFVPLADLYQEPDDPAPKVAVTFDDGYRNFLIHALPVLEQAKVPATLYVTALRAAALLPHTAPFRLPCADEPCLWADRLDITAWQYPGPLQIGTERFVQDRKRQWRRITDGTALKQLCKQRRPPFLTSVLEQLALRWRRRSMEPDLLPDLDDYWRLLDETDLRKLAGHGLVTIGAHGVSHCNLSTLSTLESHGELLVGKQWLERVTGLPVHDFAWPDGDHTPSLVELAHSVGYRRQGLTDYQSASEATDPRLISRLGVNPYISVRAQRGIIAQGGYGHEVYGP